MIVEIDRTFETRGDLDPATARARPAGDGGVLSSAQVPRLLAELRQLTGASYIWHHARGRESGRSPRKQTLTFVPLSLGASGLPVLHIDVDGESARILGGRVRASCRDAHQGGLTSRVVAWLTRCFPGLVEATNGAPANGGVSS